MEALIRWLVDNGWDTSLVTYVGAAVFLVAMIAIYLYIRGDKRSPDKAADKATAKSADKAATKAATKSTAKSATKAAAKSTAKSTAKSAAKSAAKSKAQPADAVAKPADDAIATGYAGRGGDVALRQPDEVPANERALAEPEAEEAVPVPAEPAAGAEAVETLAELAKPGTEPAVEGPGDDKATAATVELPEKKGMFARIRAGLSRTKANFGSQLGNLFLGAKEIDDDLLEEIETLLLTADVGVEATSEIIRRLTERVARKQLADPEALQQGLQEELASLLREAEQPLELATDKSPYVILMVGVNGVGKTTTIGKLAKRFQSEGRSVMLAAGDTFRAAAVEQLQVWGERNKVPVVAQHTGADSASVLFDALQSAKARGIDVLIADTAGRLQNKDNLMQELQKVVRVMKKLDPEAPHEVMLVLDAGTGQNALSQARIFREAVGVSGISLTKLDGTAKGGIIFAIAKQLGLPIRFIGVGEQVDDLRPFQADEFVRALFD